MPLRKKRIPVVFDTNLMIAFHLSKNPDSANVRAYRLWRNERKLQLVVSDDTVAEYLEILERIGVADQSIKRIERRLRSRKTVTWVNLGARPVVSRDPDDDVVIATAIAGKAKYLVTNDRDLLDIPTRERKKLRFKIVSPSEFLIRLESKN